MFKNLFKKAAAAPVPQKEPTILPKSAAEVFMHAIAERRQEDPLIGAKIGAKEIVQRIIAAIETPKGVHIETLLGIVGSLAGYSCQASLRAECIQSQGLAENQVFVIMTGADGRKYYFGDRLNKPLAECQYSVWGLSAGAAQDLGAKDLIAIDEVFAHVAGTVGSDLFGIPRIPENHKPSDLPANYVKFIWSKFLPIVKQYCASPAEWPILFGLAAQEALGMGKNVIDPALALAIVMECAIPMSKVDIDAL